MMRRYLNNSLLIDFIICVFLCISINVLRPYLKGIVILPGFETIAKSMDSIVKVSTTLIGFLLTIVGIIVTFKNNYDSQKTSNTNFNSENINDPNIPPSTNVFTQPVSRKEQFYNTDLHKKVMNVFLAAVYEFVIVVFLFISFQSGLFSLSRFWSVLATSLGFVIIGLALIRSLYIYRLFLNVHIKNKN